MNLNKKKRILSKLENRLKKRKYHKYSKLYDEFLIVMSKKYNCDIGLILDYLTESERDTENKLAIKYINEDYKYSKIIKRYGAYLWIVI